MSDKYLNRSDAPFGATLWEALDGAVIGAARSQLSARRLLKIQGPYGLALKGIPGLDKTVEGKASVEGATIRVGPTTPLASIQTTFALGARDVALIEETGLPASLQAAADAAIACARLEDAILFYGSDALGVEGLLTAKGVQSHKLQPWNEIGVAADDVIQAVTKLDGAGFHGPYALALTPSLFNLLFRRYLQGNMTELEHIKQIVTDGIVKAASIKAGGALLAAGVEFASIVVGQDLSAGFVGPTAGGYEFTVSESLALRLMVPASVCVLK